MLCANYCRNGSTYVDIQQNKQGIVFLVRAVCLSGAATTVNSCVSSSLQSTREFHTSSAPINGRHQVSAASFSIHFCLQPRPVPSRPIVSQRMYFTMQVALQIPRESSTFYRVTVVNYYQLPQQHQQLFL